MTVEVNAFSFAVSLRRKLDPVSRIGDNCFVGRGLAWRESGTGFSSPWLHRISAVRSEKQLKIPIMIRPAVQ